MADDTGDMPPVSDEVLMQLPAVEEEAGGNGDDSKVASGEEGASPPAAENGEEPDAAASPAEEGGPTLLEDSHGDGQVSGEKDSSDKVEAEESDGLNEYGLPKGMKLKEESYKKYDVTNKYTFAEFELSEFADSFALYDLLGDQHLTAGQMVQAMMLAGYDEDEIVIKRAINDVDPEGMGSFSFQHFIDFMSHFRRPPLTEVELRETFDFLDKDKGGSIDAAELKQLLTSLGHALTADEAYAMVDEADKDGSGEIEFDEFSHIILSTQA